MEDACGKCAVNPSLIEDIGEMLHGPGSTGSDERNIAYFSDPAQLLDIVSLPDAILVHAIQHDFTGAAFLNLASPVERVPATCCCLVRISRELIDTIRAVFRAAVDTDHDTLGAESFCQLLDQVGIRERGAIDRNFVGTVIENLLGVANTANATRNRKRNIQHAGHPVDPRPIDGSSVGARGNVVKYEFVSAFVDIPARKFHDPAHDLVIAELDAFDDLTVTNVEAGYYSPRKNFLISSADNRPSSNALPVTARATPVPSSARKSATSRIPPEAINSASGNRATQVL